MIGLGNVSSETALKIGTLISVAFAGTILVWNFMNS